MTYQPTYGDFVWFDLMTTDLPASIAFYTELIPQWSVTRRTPVPGYGYHVIDVDGRPTAGMVAMDAGGPPPHWISYVGVPDCEASTARAQALGAEVPVPCFHLPGVGRMAVLADPEGAYIKPLQWDTPPTPFDSREPGRFSWCELLSRDTEAAAAFYPELFGWTAQKIPMGPQPYLLWRLNDKEIGGAMPMPPDAQAPAAWLPYLTVTDVDDTAARATAGGGSICKPPADIPDVGRLAVLADPTGARFAVFRSAH